MKKIALMLGMLSTLLSTAAWSVPEGDPTMITYIRTVDESTYVEVESGALCGTNTFWLEGSYPGAKKILSNLMMALAAGKRVKIEVRTDKGCEGWGSKIAGVTVLR